MGNRYATHQATHTPMPTQMRIQLDAIPKAHPVPLCQTRIHLALLTQRTQPLVQLAINAMRRDLVPGSQMIRYIRKRARRDARAGPAKVRKRRAGSEIGGVGFLGPVGLCAGVCAFGAERVFVGGDEGAVEG